MAYRVLTLPCTGSSQQQLKLLSDLLIRSFSSGPKNVGFIGLGNMGGPMASNLMAKVSGGLTFPIRRIHTARSRYVKGVWISFFFSSFLWSKIAHKHSRVPVGEDTSLHRSTPPHMG
uniref:6-phosphogluconate dehydrogenase NADP-binding domain-containing protein n=1 Tax=Anopheles melas TaxID=34690 RepID=A0A182TZP4_9DIPT